MAQTPTKFDVFFYGFLSILMVTFSLGTITCAGFTTGIGLNDFWNGNKFSGSQMIFTSVYVWTLALFTCWYTSKTIAETNKLANGNAFKTKKPIPYVKNFLILLTIAASYFIGTGIFGVLYGEYDIAITCLCIGMAVTSLLLMARITQLIAKKKVDAAYGIASLFGITGMLLSTVTISIALKLLFFIEKVESPILLGLLGLICSAVAITSLMIAVFIKRMRDKVVKELKQ